MEQKDIKQFDSQAVTDRIKALLRDSGMTREELSKKTGITVSTINSHLGGKKAKMIAIDSLYKYAQVLGVTVDYLITGETKKECRELTPIEKCYDIILFVLQNYGESNFKIWEEEVFDVDCYREIIRKTLTLTLPFQNCTEYFEKISPIVQQEKLLKELGVYELALEKIKKEVDPVLYSILDEDGDLPF